jgi:hypothetical protein
MSRQRFLKYGAAVSGFASTVLLLLSLTLSSSSFKPILTEDGAHLCFGGKLLAAGYGGPLVLTSEPCPGWKTGKPAALVSAEHRDYEWCGFGLLAISFLLQLIDIRFDSSAERVGISSRPFSTPGQPTA